MISSLTTGALEVTRRPRSDSATLRHLTNRRVFIITTFFLKTGECRNHICKHLIMTGNSTQRVQ